MLVSTQGPESLSMLDEDPEGSEGRINFLMRNRHGTPFEHGYMEFFVHAPIFVYREWHRHRIGWSYNEESGRYKQLDPVFYEPPRHRNLVQTGKPGAYEFVPGTDDQYAIVQDTIRYNSLQAYEAYEHLLAEGIAKEVARMVLPVNIFSSMYAACNPRSLMAFLSLRIDYPDATFPSKPMFEIQTCGEQMEKEFSQLCPITYDKFIQNGKVSP